MRRLFTQVHAVTLVEVMVAAAVVAIGLGAIFAANSQIFFLLKKAKETVAARQYIHARLEELKNVSFVQLCNSSYLETKVLSSGTNGDAIRNSKPIMDLISGTVFESVAVFAMGDQLLNDLATDVPIKAGILGSLPCPAQYPADATALSTPRSYRSGSTNAGSWSSYAFGTPLIIVNRTGFGLEATNTVITSGNLSSNAVIPGQVRVDVKLSWRGANQTVRSCMGSIIVSRSGSL